METGATSLPLETKATYSIVPHLGKDLPSAYRNMVLAKWLRTLRFGNDFFRLIESDTYFEVYQKYIKNLIDRPQCIIRIAVLTDETDVCLGFSVSEPDVLHFCWVHKDNRRIGVGKALVPFHFSSITHLTTTGMTIWNRKLPGVHFNPFL